MIVLITTIAILYFNSQQDKRKVITSENLFLWTVDGSECEFKDKDILYQFSVDEKEEGEKPGDEEYTEEDLDDALLMLSRSGPDAQLRLALRKR